MSILSDVTNGRYMRGNAVNLLDDSGGMCMFHSIWSFGLILCGLILVSVSGG